ncbi:MAG: DUF4097 family beta strand repeat-containing protein [Eubacteriales bacterium]|jgi:hypothetical protein
MKRTMKVLAIIAACLLGAGILVCGGTIAATGAGWTEIRSWLEVPLDIVRTDNGGYRVEPGRRFENLQQRTYTASGAVDALELSMVNENIELRAADIDRVRVIYYEEFEGQYQFTESNGKLIFERASDRGVIARFGFDFNAIPVFNDAIPTFIVEYPAKNVPQTLKLSTVNGDYRLDAMTVRSAEIDSTNGNTQLNSLTAQSFRFETVNGELTGFLTADECSLNTTNGEVDLTLDTRDASLKFVNTDYRLTLGGDPTAYGFDFTYVNTDLEVNGEEVEAQAFGLTKDGVVILSRKDQTRMIKINGVNGKVNIKTEG